MGGSGGGGGGGPQPPSKTPIVDPGDVCDLILTAPVNGVNASVLGTLTIGSVLNVCAGGPHGRTIEIVTAANQVLGSIVGVARAGTLLDCIAKGNVYVATIQTISGGLVQVEITRRSSP